MTKMSVWPGWLRWLARSAPCSTCNPAFESHRYVCMYVQVRESNNLAAKRSAHATSVLYPDSGISMDEEIVLGVMMWSYNKAEL